MILSRTDGIGDVVLTLPMAGWIKKHFPLSKVYFLGRNYTRDVVAMSQHVDGFIDYNELEAQSPSDAARQLRVIEADVIVHVFPVKKIARLARNAGIAWRAGTSHRWYHWIFCNKRIALTRRRSPLHEAQLDIKLLDFLGINTAVSIDEISSLYGFSHVKPLAPAMAQLLDNNKFNLILHPKSKGSAKEWGIANFEKLVGQLPKNRFKIFITGTESEGKLMQELISNASVTDLSGKLSLEQLIAFIGRADGLVAASTGPLHIAAALGKKAVGLFVPKRPIHPGRWMPVGKDAHYLVFDENCKDCESGKVCNCIAQISPQQVIDLLTRK